MLNIILGKLFGVYGIIAATIISLFFCNYLWSVGITFRLYFSLGRRKDYYRTQGLHTLLTLAACLLSYAACSLLSPAQPVGAVAVRAAVCILVPNAVFFLAYRKSDRFRYAREKVIGAKR